jgi:predicted amidophosphoribosyltransferase
VRHLLDLLIPARCALCGRGVDPVCPACLAALPVLGGPGCGRCGKPTAAPVADCRECRGRRLGFDTAAAALAFEGRGRDLVLRFKDAGLRGLSDPAAGLVATIVPRPECDLVTWVPADRWRTIGRGYHPPQVLADRLARKWGVPARALLGAAPIRRPQRGLDHAARRRNVRGAFRPLAALAGERVAVIDDVFTTGATLSACGTALRAAGAGGVAAVSLARVVRI